MITNRIAYWRSTMNNGKGISQARLAQLVGVGRSYIKKLERGTRLPSWGLAFRLARVLKQPLELIFLPKELVQTAPDIFCANTIPYSQSSVFTPAPAKPLCTSPATLPARPAVPVVITDKSPVNPAAKVVAPLSRSKPNGKK